MPRIFTAALPAWAAVHDLTRRGDFLDCYAAVSDMPAPEAMRLGLAMPGWAMALLRLRNALVAPFGLRTEAPAGPSFGLFPILKDTPQEVLLGFDDSHLNFRITVLSQAGRIYLSTWMHPHNRYGRAYLALVMPFHVLIVKDSLRRIARGPSHVASGRGAS
ncbi:DUF2867 domain-containing protein [Pseudooceanicola sp. CBS1P-1]|uniref:DUF2867 domain-containing protein n=2 Tax=Paracoccaceae TaxID=31989 RepID=A0A6L7G069_9RHOB|nr:DUF2867 domain-containing protein [Pseudooceanicola endophyticus]MXN16910.1 DUF2867 domain-containing protein [Pseudooceanicola albus]